MMNNNNNDNNNKRLCQKKWEKKQLTTSEGDSVRIGLYTPYERYNPMRGGWKPLQFILDGSSPFRWWFTLIHHHHHRQSLLLVPCSLSKRNKNKQRNSVWSCWWCYCSIVFIFLISFYNVTWMNNWLSTKKVLLQEHSYSPLGQSLHFQEIRCTQPWCWQNCTPLSSGIENRQEEAPSESYEWSMSPIYPTTKFWDKAEE